jgi:hypothetical protein
MAVAMLMSVIMRVDVAMIAISAALWLKRLLDVARNPTEAFDHCCEDMIMSDKDPFRLHLRRCMAVA